MNEESLFFEALDLPASERAAFLDRACATDPALRASVERLLAAHEKSGSFLDRAPESSSEWTAGPTPPIGGASMETPLTFDRRAYAAPDMVIAGRYSLIEKIGEGGMGEVWVARQFEPVRRKVALKLIKAGTDSRSVLVRFEQERQALAIMDHPNIARVLDGGLTQTGYPYFVMELVKGVPIDDYCDAYRLTPQQRLELFVPVCNAIQHAHQKGVIHRDIKPSNVLVALYDDRAVPKVIDFGVAKATGASLTDQSAHTMFGGVVGTPQYMSPEQASLNNLDIDTRSDIYSLGVLLYELLVGSPPFGKRELDAAGVLEILRVIREVDPPRPSTKLSTAEALPSLSANRGMEPKKLAGLLRGDLDWIVMKALEKDRARRYETANGFAADIERYLAGETVLAHPPSASYRARKFVRKHRGGVLAAGLIFVSLVSGVVGTTLGLVSAQRARAQAEADALRAQRAEEQTLADYRDATDDAIAQLIGSKPELGAKERAFLESTAKRWRGFASRQGDDRQSRAIRAEGHHRVGVLWGKLGRHDESLAELQIARDLWQALAKDFPADERFRTELGQALQTLGILYRQAGRIAEAKAQYVAARDLNVTLVREQSDNTAARKNLANNHNNLANLHAAAGDNVEAKTAYLAAIELLKSLVEELPNDRDYLQELARTRNNFALLLNGTGKHAEALAEMQAALDLRKQLVERFAGAAENRYGLARTYNNMGALQLTLNEHAKAQPFFSAAADLQAKLVAEFPAVPRYRQDYANALSNEAQCLSALNKYDEALRKHQAARDAHVKLAADFPNSTTHSLDLSVAEANLGLVLGDLGRGPESLAAFAAAARVAGELTQRVPGVVAHWSALGSAHYNAASHFVNERKYAASLPDFALALRALDHALKKSPNDSSTRATAIKAHRRRAIALDQLGRMAEAEADWRRAIELAVEDEKPLVQASKAATQIRTGRVAVGVLALNAALAKKAADKSWPLTTWYDLAGAYGVAAAKLPDQQAACADRAMECLRLAVQSGYRNRQLLATDPELLPLRDRADFKKLLADISN